jgi:hypothetical protein
MTANGAAPHLLSFDDVEDEFRAVRIEHANALGEIMQAIGSLGAEVSHLRRADDELRRVIVERSHMPQLPPMRAELPSGVDMLVEAAVALKAAGDDERRPVTSDRVRAMFASEAKRMRLEASASRWDRFVGLLPAMGREALKVLVTLSLTGAVAELVHLLGRH